MNVVTVCYAVPTPELHKILSCLFLSFDFATSCCRSWTKRRFFVSSPSVKSDGFHGFWGEMEEAGNITVIWAPLQILLFSAGIKRNLACGMALLSTASSAPHPKADADVQAFSLLWQSSAKRSRAPPCDVVPLMSWAEELSWPRVALLSSVSLHPSLLSFDPSLSLSVVPPPPPTFISPLSSVISPSAFVPLLPTGHIALTVLSGT